MPTYKTPRLRTFDYVGPFAYSLTTVTSNRARVFREAMLVTTAEGQLLASAAKFGFIRDGLLLHARSCATSSR